MKKFILLFAVACFIMSCNVTESIVFNNDMSGKYSSSFDLSPMLQYASSNRPSSVEEEEKEKRDTIIVFNDLFKAYKDSIASLSEEQRARLEKLRGTTMEVHMDEAEDVFTFSMTRPFQDFSELKEMDGQLDATFDVMKEMENKDGKASGAQLDKMTEDEETTYTFKDNTFSRFVQVEEEEKVEEEAETDDFSKQFEEVFSQSYNTLIYTFPRKVKSVSQKGAVISEDGKTVTYKVPWNEIHKDNTLINLEVILED